MDSTRPVNYISLCSGYEGIGIGLARAIRGLRAVAYCEREMFAIENLLAKIEEGYLDPAPVHTDLRTFPFSEFRGKVGIISGGFPCQPFSAAGKRGGDEDPRHLFPYILRGITECQPELVFLENVEGIVSAKLAGTGWRDPAGTPVLLHVLRELERVGYRATAGVFSSAEVGATHQRKRVFILGRKMADTLHDGRDGPEGPRGAGPSENQGWVLQPEGVGSPQRDIYLRPKPPGPDQWWWEPARVVSKSVAYTTDNGCCKRGGGAGSSLQGECSERTGEYTRSERAGQLSGRPEGLGGSVGDASLVQCDGGDNHTGISPESGSFPQSGDASGSVHVAHGSHHGSQPQRELSELRYEKGREESSGLPTAEGQQRGEPQQETDGPVKSSLGRDSHGSPGWMDYAELSTTVDNRTDELRLLGNGVDPAVAAKAFLTLIGRLTN